MTKLHRCPECGRSYKGDFPECLDCFREQLELAAETGEHLAAAKEHAERYAELRREMIAKRQAQDSQGQRREAEGVEG